MLRSEISNRANGELHCPVDSKLVLLERVGETGRALRGCIESAWRNLVIQVAGSNRQKLCRPNRDVHLGDRYVPLRRSRSRRGLERPGLVQERRARESRLARIPSHVHRAHQVQQVQQVRPLPGQHTARPATSNRPPEHLAPDTAQTLRVPRIPSPRTSPSRRTLRLREVRTVTRREMATAMPARDRSRTRQNCACFSSDRRAKRPCVFARCVR